MAFMESREPQTRPGTRILTLALFFLALLVGGLQMFGNESTVRVTMKESGTSITVHQGDVVEVMLPAVLGTGYSWKIDKTAGPVLTAKGQPETLPAESGHKPGDPEYQLFRFAAQSKGTGQLVLHYVRPWEKKAKPAREFCLTVQVQ